MRELYNVVMSIIMIYGLYYLTTSLFSFFDNKNIFKKRKAKTRFMVVIPARNEEFVVGNLIDSLKEQNYPNDLYTINVVINNCCDNTKKIALDHGANIIDIKKRVTSKGEVLKYVFSKFKKAKDFDAYVVFDADNVVDKNFLSEMNNAYIAGYKVSQGFRDTKNLHDNWLSGSYALFYYFQNEFFNQSRANVNSSASLNGTGFYADKEFIDKVDFTPVTLTEDIELTIICAINNVKIGYVPKAITYDEQPVTFGASWTQRKRWTKGTMQNRKNYLSLLFNGFVSNKTLSKSDMAFITIGPMVQVFTVILLFLNTIFSGFSGFITIDFTGAIITYLLEVLLNIYLVEKNGKDANKLISGIFMFPFFLITWLPINVLCAFKKDIKWKEIAHNRTIDIKSVGD